MPLPESVVAQDMEWRKHEVIHGLDHDEDRLTQLIEAEGQSREEWDKELRDAAEKSVRAQFILDAIADEREITVGDAELTEYLIRQARQYDMSPQQFAQTLMQNGNLPAVMADVRRNKALATALEAATVTDASGRAGRPVGAHAAAGHARGRRGAHDADRHHLRGRRRRRRRDADEDLAGTRGHHGDDEAGTDD